MKSSNKGGDPCGASTNQRRRIRICQGFSTLVKYGKNSEGVSSQGPKKAGGGGMLFWHKSEKAHGFYSGLNEMSFKVY